ncbi:hypothetical protein CAP51_07055 [Acinetobacter populi]|uniref:Uncharacterized protein n=2 Tax=Acinetobacter populi TaxID=1582270 RepID=A0A1Z9Z094_9GAMM|nr:hypothetical protein CAP51_07055 [Acinetobacter populi]
MQALNTPLQWLRWVLGDISEAQFYKSEFASLGLLLGATFAYFVGLKKKPWQGFEISYGSGLFPWILLSSGLGLLLSNIFWDWLVIYSGNWQPTFVAFVSLPAATVLMFGRGIRVALTGAIAGAILVTPCSIFIINYVCRPLELPYIIGNVLGMAFGSLLAFFLFYKFPCLINGQLKSSTSIEKEIEEEVTIVSETKVFGPKWVVRRMFSDFSESQFFANEWAGLGFLTGVLLAIYLNPLGIAYGSGLITKIVIAQMLSSAIAVVLWQKQWQKYGWYPTYIPISSVAPVAVLVFGGSFISILFGALLGAIIAPPLAAYISKKLATYQHPYIGNVVSMAVTSLLTIGVIHLIS